MNITLKLEGEGFTYENTKLSLSQAIGIIGFVSAPEENQLSPATTSQVLEPQSLETLPSATEPVSSEVTFDSPREAIDQLQAKTNPQKIVAIALYLGATSTNGNILQVSEISENFQKAGEKPPKNMTRDLDRAVADCYIFRESKGEFRLLKGVDEVVKNGVFPKQSAKVKRTKSVPKTPRINKEPQPAVLELDFEANLEGYGQVFNINSLNDRALWILEYAKAKEIQSLSRYDIIHISNQLGVQIHSKNFTAIGRRNVQQAFVSYQGGQYTLTPRGENHLKEVANAK